MPARRRKQQISQPEIERRQRQRKIPRPAYCALGDSVLPPGTDADLEPMSAGARNVLLNAQPPPLLHTRAQAARMLSCSIASLQRLEKVGRLKAVKLGTSPTSATYYRTDDLVRLASGGDDAR